MGKILPAGMDCAGLFPKYITTRRGSLILCIIGIIIQPWRFVTQSSTFLSVLSSFGGLYSWSSLFDSSPSRQLIHHSIRRPSDGNSSCRLLVDPQTQMENSGLIQPGWYLLVYLRHQLARNVRLFHQHCLVYAYVPMLIIFCFCYNTDILYP
jgi:hypothetical protein